MKNTKHQTPNTKQISNTKYPTTREGNGDSRSEWGLRDEPAKNEGGRHPFDFEESTSIFGEKIVRFAKRIPRGPVNDRLINQVVGAGTSIGANFSEANDCVSKKDFRNSVKRNQGSKRDATFFANDRRVRTRINRRGPHPVP